MSWKDEVADLLRRTRARTLALVEVIPESELRRQVREFLSPPIWDLGHIARFEETWLIEAVVDGAPRGLDGIYDPFRNPRSSRGRMSLPGLAEVRRYLDDVRRRALDVLDRIHAHPGSPLLRDGFVHRMVVQHEAQHQETLLQALDIPEPGWGWVPPTSAGAADRMAGPGFDAAERTAGPEFEAAGGTPRPGFDAADRDCERVEVPGGPFDMGTDDRSRAYDNERPRHRVDVAGFEIDRFPVSVRRWLEFIADGGYRERAHWSEQGWAAMAEEGWEHPQGWRRCGGGSWRVRRFGVERPLDEREPVQHVSFHEAEAFARWAGGRLPTEAEWERAATLEPHGGGSRLRPWGDAAADAGRANVGAVRRGPAPLGSFPSGASALGVEQMLGDVYEWTSSSFDGYPGFEPFPYREYSEVFFGGPYRVLRGCSWAIDPLLARNTYRNWDLPRRRQIFAGVRLAWDPA